MAVTHSENAISMESHAIPMSSPVPAEVEHPIDMPEGQSTSPANGAFYHKVAQLQSQVVALTRQLNVERQQTAINMSHIKNWMQALTQRISINEYQLYLQQQQ